MAGRDESPKVGARRSPGRPRISEEELRVVAFKLPLSTLASFDARAAKAGQTRSQRLRMLVDRDR